MGQAQEEMCHSRWQAHSSIPFGASAVSIKAPTSHTAPVLKVDGVTAGSGRSEMTEKTEEEEESESGSALCLVRSNENFLGHSGSLSWRKIDFYAAPHTSTILVFFLIYLFGVILPLFDRNPGHRGKDNSIQPRDISSNNWDSECPTATILKNEMQIQRLLDPFWTHQLPKSSKKVQSHLNV